MYGGRPSNMAVAIGVLLRGLPFNVRLDDISQFFSTLNIAKNRIDMMYMYDGKFSGLAFVQLRNKDEVKVALLMDRNHIGDRYIDVMEVSEQKLDQIRKAAMSGIRRLELHRMCSSDVGGERSQDNGGHRSRGGGGGSGNGAVRQRSRSPLMRNPRTRFAYVTGFPQNTLYKGVRSFFDGCIIGVGCVHLFRGENDKFRGDGYIEFASSEELKKALKRNGDRYQGSYMITIEPCSEEEVLDMKPYMMEKARPSRGKGGGPPHFEEGYGGYRDREDYGGYRYESVGSYRGNTRSREGSSSHARYDSFSHNRWTGYRENEREHPPNDMPRQMVYESPYVEGTRGTRRGNDLKRDFEESYTTERYSSTHPGHSGISISSGREKKTVRMHGLPPTATISDIVSFFKNYGVEYESVRVQCFDDGTPNGKAFVTFPSERIAHAALHDMNRRLLKNNYIELSPV